MLLREKNKELRKVPFTKQRHWVYKLILETANIDLRNLEWLQTAQRGNIPALL